MADEKITGRCMRCKDSKEMKDVEISTTKNGARMAKGTCVDCGCKMAKILPKEKPAE
jgi:hypothetical protein